MDVKEGMSEDQKLREVEKMGSIMDIVREMKDKYRKVNKFNSKGQNS